MLKGRALRVCHLSEILEILIISLLATLNKKNVVVVVYFEY